MVFGFYVISIWSFVHVFWSPFWRFWRFRTGLYALIIAPGPSKNVVLWQCQHDSQKSCFFIEKSGILKIMVFEHKKELQKEHFFVSRAHFWAVPFGITFWKKTRFWPDPILDHFWSILGPLLDDCLIDFWIFFDAKT